MTIKTGLYNNYVTYSTHGSSVSSLPRARQVPERFTMNHQQPSLSSSQCETPGGLTKPSTFCRATSHWSPPSQSVTLPGTWQFPGHRGAFHTTSCPLFQAAVLQHQAFKQINKQVQMQPALYNQNLLCSAEGESAAGQSHNKCIKPRFLIPPCTTNCWCVPDFENKQKQPKWTLQVAMKSVAAPTQTTDVHPQPPGGPGFCKSHSQKSENQGSSAKTDFYSPISSSLECHLLQWLTLGQRLARRLEQ